MSDKILRHGHASDTAANWKANNPVVGKGEFAIESDTGKFKIGNGTKKYNELNYSYVDNSIVDNLTSTDTNKALSANQGKLLKDDLDKKANQSDIDTINKALSGAYRNGGNIDHIKVDLPVTDTSLINTMYNATNDDEYYGSTNELGCHFRYKYTSLIQDIKITRNGDYYYIQIPVANIPSQCYYIDNYQRRCLYKRLDKIAIKPLTVPASAEFEFTYEQTIHTEDTNPSLDEFRFSYSDYSGGPDLKEGNTLIEPNFVDNVWTVGDTNVAWRYSINADENFVITEDGINVLSCDVTDYVSKTSFENLSKTINKNAEDVALLQYYGTTNITISDSSYFTVTESGETITGLTDTGKNQTELVIPYKINGIEITTLHSGVDTVQPQSILEGSSTITKIIVPKSVTTLGRGAFADCQSLTSINIPNSITSIGEAAFSGCTSLTSINIPNSITSIGNTAFMGCISLKSITIPNSVTSIGQNDFYNCSSLTSINIPNSVTSIETNSFNRCANLTIYCEQGSYAETFAKTNNIPLAYNVVKDITSSKVTTITVPTTGWTTSTDTNGTTYYSINITDSILTSTSYPITDVVLPSDIAAARLQSKAYQNINKITVNDGSVDLYCFDSLPTVSFQIRIQLLYI